MVYLHGFCYYDTVNDDRVFEPNSAVINVLHQKKPGIVFKNSFIWNIYENITFTGNAAHAY